MNPPFPDWSMGYPSPGARQQIASAAAAALPVERVEGALHAAMNIGRTSLKKMLDENLLTPQEWVDMMWCVAAWMIGRHPVETLHFRLYMHLRFTLGFSVEDTLDLISDVRTPSDSDFTPLTSVTL